MRDFRIIMQSEREWKQINEQKNDAGGGLDALMKQHLEELGEDGAF